MSQWISRLPVKPIHLALATVVLYYTIHYPAPLTLGLLAFILCRLFWGNGRARLKFVLPMLMGAGLVFGGHRYLAYRANATAPDQINQIQILPDTISVNGDSLSFRGKSDGRLYQVFYKLKSQEEQRFFQQVSQPLLLTIEAEVSEAEGQRNFNGFDYQRYLESQGIYKVVSISAITEMRTVQTLNPLDILSSWRRSALVHIKSRFPQPMSHYMTGLLFGHLDKDFAEMSDLYSNLGIIHLFALSGMQVGFFVDHFRRILLRLGFRQERVNQWQIPFSIIYAGLTGFSPSVIRSLIQKNLGNAGLRGLDNFAVTVLVSLFLVPNILLTAGGVLSFAYAFILTMTNFDGLQGLKKVVAESATISLGILPLLIWYFATFQPASMVLTFALSVVFDLVLLPLLSLLFLLSPLWAIAELNPLFLGLEAIIRSAASWVRYPLVFGQPVLWVLLALLILMGLIYDFKRRPKFVVSLVACVALLFFLTKKPLTNEITIVDIGQGDSIFLRDVHGRTVLIDVGGKVTFSPNQEWQVRHSDSNASRTLIPYLRSRGVGQLDKLLLTHTDTDHIGDLLEVAKAFPIKEIWVSPGSLTEESFIQKLEQVGSPVHVTKVGDQLPIFDSSLEVLYPMTTGDGSNNDSIVLYGKLLGTRFLFTGDLEEAGEGILMATYPELKVDVLKAGHHGSKGSSSPAFLQHLQPQIALMSSGKNNRYKHPHQETLERFEDIGSRIYRTDQQGAIRFIGWDSWQVETVR